MTKELYDKIITDASENELAGILRVAAFDFDITPAEFLKLAERVDTIKEKCEEMAMETEEKPLEEMNILEMVDYFMEQGMTEEQANDLAYAEWQARVITIKEKCEEIRK